MRKEYLKIVYIIFLVQQVYFCSYFTQLDFFLLNKNAI